MSTLNFTCPLSDFQTDVRRNVHCSVAVRHVNNDLLLLKCSLVAWGAPRQTPVRLNKFLPVCCQHLLTTPKASFRVEKGKKYPGFI